MSFAKLVGVCGDSGVPGVVVLNLHPQNIEKTQDMHAAARELVQQGFVAWTVADMISWFGQRDAICADTGAAYEYGLSLMSMSPQTRPLDHSELSKLRLSELAHRALSLRS